MLRSEALFKTLSTRLPLIHLFAHLTADSFCSSRKMCVVPSAQTVWERLYFFLTVGFIQSLQRQHLKFLSGAGTWSSVERGYGIR